MISQAGRRVDFRDDLTELIDSLKQSQQFEALNHKIKRACTETPDKEDCNCNLTRYANTAGNVMDSITKAIQQKA